MHKVTVELVGDKWVLKLKDKSSFGFMMHRRIRNRGHINAFVEYLDNPDTVFAMGKDIKLCYSDCEVTLKNYEEYKNKNLYNIITQKIAPDTPFVDVTHANIEKIASLTKKVINIRSVATVALSAVVISAFIPKEEEHEVVDLKPIYIESPVEVEESLDIENVVENSEFIPSEVTDHMSLIYRVEELSNLSLASEKGMFNVGGKLDSYTLNVMTSYMEENGDMYLDIANKYGLDPYCLLSFSMTESSLDHEATIPGGERFNGYAYGVMQIEKTNIGGTVTAFNYQTNEYESVYITEDKLKDFESNVQIGAMLLQNSLEKYNNNIYITTQAHNYGIHMMNILINKYALEVGKTFDEVTSDINDFGWMKYVKDLHDNPDKYLSNWNHPTYGNDKYINSVLGYYIGQKMYINSGDNYYVYDLVSNTCELQSKQNDLEIKYLSSN